MLKIIISADDSGQRLDKFLLKSFPKLNKGAVYKYIRLKRVKLNHSRASGSQILSPGDVLELYINDELLQRADTPVPIHSGTLNIAYEDENILLADKPAGLLCHSGNSEETDNLVARLQFYLYRKGEYDPDSALSFSPALCNRLDRNTGGLVIAAKNAAALREINAKIRIGQVRKYYLCLVSGNPEPNAGTLKGYHTKDSRAIKAEITAEPFVGNNMSNPQSKPAECRYRTLRSDKDYSLIEVELITGRFHQIRAQFAAIGHPLAGDVKYGARREEKLKHQVLYAYKIVFDFKDTGGILGYLQGKEIIVDSAIG